MFHLERPRLEHYPENNYPLRNTHITEGDPNTCCLHSHFYHSKQIRALTISLKSLTSFEFQVLEAAIVIFSPVSPVSSLSSLSPGYLECTEAN